MTSKPCLFGSHWLSYCCLVLICLLSLSIRADELKITPNTCAITLERPTCHLNLLIEYQSKIPQSLCLWIVKHTTALVCFNDSLNFKYQVQLTIAEDTLLELRDLKNNQIVTTELVKVAKFEPANTRRRRGLNWNLL